MDMSTLVWLFVSVLCYHCGFFRYANCTTVHIYATTKPHSVLASVQHIGRTNFSFDTNLSDQDGLQLLFVEPLSGAVRLNYFPDCESLTKNPFVVFVRSFAVSKPSGEIYQASYCICSWGRLLREVSEARFAVYDCKP